MNLKLPQTSIRLKIDRLFSVDNNSNEFKISERTKLLSNIICRWYYYMY